MHPKNIERDVTRKKKKEKKNRSYCEGTRRQQRMGLHK